jgi:formate hydrogenlyase subunit 6/NADH:ubiquinone oxidoreductase subunit I
MGIARYIKDIKDTVTSVFEGMAITFSHLVRRPMTIQYPDKIPVPIQETLPRRYRGILEVDMDICTGSLACERDCPITYHDRYRNGKGDQTEEIYHFDIDICNPYCGLCSRLVRQEPSATPGVRRGKLQPGRVSPPFRDTTGTAL